MKRVFQHPPAPTSGRRYWRSTDELADTPEFREWLEREFPSSAAQLNGDEWSRRSFLKLMGASVALAGFGVSSCRRPEMHLVPFTKTVEWTIPGKFLYYSTAMPRRNGAIPLLVTTVDGRPIKLDGNPLHPTSNGASDVFVQAAINELYNPLRAKRIAENGQTSTAPAFEKYLGALPKKMGDGAGLWRLLASQIPLIAHAIATRVATATKDAGLGSVLATLQVPAGATQFDEQWLNEAVNDLVSKSGASLVLAGAQQPVVVQLLVYGINSALKNIGRTVLLRELNRNQRDNSILQLAGEIAADRIKQLFILGANPVFNAPRRVTYDLAKGWLDWPELQKKVPDVVRLGYYEDETSARCRWNLPASDFLESWGDALSSEGHYLAIQPMILPLFGGLSELDLLNAVMGKPKVDGPELVQETFQASKPVGDRATAWSKFLHDGFASYIVLRDQPPAFNGNTAGGIGHNLWGPPGPPPTPESPEIVLVRDYSIDDGRYVNNSWLQEMPDPITKLTWDNAALISPRYARALGVETGDLIRIAVSDASPKTPPPAEGQPAPPPRRPPAVREL